MAALQYAQRPEAPAHLTAGPTKRPVLSFPSRPPVPSTAPAVAELPTLSAVTVSVESVFCLNARVTLDVTAELVAPKPSYYSRHRKQVLDKAKKTSRITLHICSCGKEIEGYDISKKHAQLMGHSIVGKRVQKMSRDEKTAEMEQKKGMLLSMGALGAVTVEVDN